MRKTALLLASIALAVVLAGGAALAASAGEGKTGNAKARGCGTVWGHTGNYPGYTQFMAASPNGKRSMTVSVNEHLSPIEGKPAVFEALRRAEVRAVCAALADR
jgi:D-alanyl-D-alanine carboxypeptidase